jgi:hypothetical protein
MAKNVLILTNFGVVFVLSFQEAQTFKALFPSRIGRDKIRAKIVPEQGIRVATYASRIQVIFWVFLCSSLFGASIHVKRAEADWK